MARAVGEEHIAPHARAWEADGTIPRALWPHLAKLGFGGLYVPEEHGGTGLTRLDATLVFEGLARSCASTAAFLSIHNMVAAMIAKRGTDDLRERVLPKALTMETFLSYCLTEPGSGSDAAALRTRAARTDEGYALTGTKALHLRRRLFGRLRRHGADRGGQTEGHQRDLRRGRRAGPLLRRAGGQDGLARAAHAAGPARRLRRTGERPPRRGGPRLRLRHGEPRRRTPQHRRLLSGRRAGRARRRRGLRAGAPRLRPPPGGVPGPPASASPTWRSR